MRNFPSRFDIQLNTYGVSPWFLRNFQSDLGSLELSYRENMMELTFVCWLTFPCECGELHYVLRLRGNCKWKMTSKLALSSFVCRSATSKLGKLSSFEERRASTESVFSCLQGDGIPAELFQILKDDAVKVLHSIWQQIWKTQQWPQDWKRSVFIPVPKKGHPKECSNYRTIALISHASKVMLKILQARLQQYVNCELSYVQAGFRKGRGTRNQIASISWIIETAREFQKKTSISALLTMPKPLTVWIPINCGKFWKR